MSEGTVRGAVERREFLKATAVVAATGSMNPSSLLSSDRASPVRLVAQQQQQEQQLIPLGNGESPALSFQAYPGGTGSLMDKLWAEHGSALFERTPPITLDSWEGPITTDEEDIAFLPVHQNANLCHRQPVHLPAQSDQPDPSSPQHFFDRPTPSLEGV